MAGLSVGSRLTSTTGLSAGSGYSRGSGLSFGGFGNSATLNLNFTTMTALPSSITFSRPSNATYFDSTGKLTYAPNNQLVSSTDFGGPYYSRLNLNVTSNAVAAPDGTLTASKLIPTSTTALHTVYASPAPVANVVSSVYVKAAEYSRFSIADLATGTFSATFDLTSGTVLSASGVTGDIQNVGGGWYRCSVFYVATNSSYRVAFSGYPAGASLTLYGPSFAGDGVSGIYVWGAQTELVTYQTTPRTYNATTLGAYYGPRFDYIYNGTAWTAAGLLIEEARTNLLTYSEQFDNAAWSKLDSTVTANATASPDGLSTADKLAETATTAEHFIQQSATAANVAHTFSVCLKAAERTNAQIAMSDLASGNASAVVNLSNGTVTSTTVSGSWSAQSATITALGNGWYRATITATKGAGTSIAGRAYTYTTTASYAGTAGSGIFVWGAQLEVGAFATSYIPTVASSVARSADAASMTGTNFSSWYNQTQGTFIYDTAYLSSSNTTGAGFVSVYSSSSENMDLRSTAVSGYTGGALGINFNIPGASVNTSFAKRAVAYKANDYAAVYSGGSVGTDTDSGGLTPNVANLYFNTTRTTASTPNGWIASLVYYPTRLSNAQLQTLTAPNLAAALALNLDFTNTGTLDPRITFSRPSNATMYDGSGNLTYAPANLVTYSEPTLAQLPIYGGNVTQASTTIAGFANSVQFGSNSQISYAYKTLTATQGVTYLMSIYVQMDDNAPPVVGQTAAIGDFCLLVNTLIPSTFFSTEVSPNLYRISAYVTAASTATGNFGIVKYTTQSAKGFRITGYQIEPVTYQTLPRSYVATTAAAYYGPRFDYNPATLQPQGLLIEEARTNLVLYSQDFSNAAWAVFSTGAAKIGVAAAASPDGTLSAYEITTGTNAGASFNAASAVYQNFTVANAVTYTASIWVRAKTGTATIRFGMNVGTSFDTGNVSVTTTWQRLTVSGLSSGAGPGNISVRTNSSGTSANVYIWGAQFEAGAFATSYIPTAASSVARSADSASMTGANFSSWYNQAQGTLYTEFTEPVLTSSLASGNSGGVTMNASGANPSIEITPTQTSIFGQARGVGGGTVSAIQILTNARNPGTSWKSAMTYTVNTTAIAQLAAVNSTLTGTNSSPTANAMTGINQLEIGKTTVSAVVTGSRWFKSVQYYNVQLSLSQLQTLTT